jgi:hypothetical protein
MRTKIQFVVCILLSASAVTEAHADEYGFSTYGLGSAAFGAGITYNFENTARDY